MLKIVTYRYFTLMLHVLAWSIVLFFPYLVSDARHEYKIGPLPGLYFTLSGIVHMLIFYGNAWVLYPKLLKRVYWPAYIIFVVLLIFVSYWVKLYIITAWFPNSSQDARTHILFPSVVAFIASLFYSITVDKIRTEKRQKESEATQLEMELKFLRSQISPHFLFNILTNFVALARKKSDQLETSILMLSGFMRYMLYDTSKKITLQQEVGYLENYIALQKLRFGAEAEIIFTVDMPDALAGCPIEPMLLIPFVENAFKHGTGYISHPLIHVELTVKESLLALEVTNKFDCETDASKDDSSGIGLNNVRSRLRLLYPNRHHLVIREDQNLFHIQLTLKLIP